MLSWKNLRLIRKNLRKLDCSTKLITNLLLKRHRDPNQIFAEAWRIVDSVQPQRSIRVRTGVPTRNIRHYQVRQVVKQIFPKFSPAISVDEDVIRMIKRSPSVIATIHASTEFAICSALDRAGLRSAIITSTPAKKFDFENYGFTSLPENILRSRDVFVQARNSLKSGRTIICDVDHRLDLSDPNSPVCVSTALFDFRLAIGVPLFFGYVRITDDGEMQCIIEPPPNNQRTAHADAISFIDFIDRCKGSASELTISSWSRVKSEGAGISASPLKNP